MTVCVPPIADIEAEFLAHRMGAPAFAAACDAALIVAAGPLRCPRMRAAVEAIAAAADAWPGPEPAYHNRHHFAEAARSMGWLGAVAVGQGLLSPAQAALGVVAMAGHDLLHDGSSPGPGVLERRSLAAIAPLIAAAGLDAAEQSLVATTVLATDPTRMAANAAALAQAGRGAPAATVLSALANEADLFASILPRLGPHLGRLLAEEWRGSSAAQMGLVGTHAGQLGFLLGIPAFSAPACSLGLDQVRKTCLAAYAALGASAQDGAARLDAMDRVQADSAYSAAVAAISPSG